jgi:MFS family permease
VGRKTVIFVMSALGAGCFVLFYSGLEGWFVPVSWVAAMAGYFTTDALLAGFSSEIVPTAYRATVSGLRYTISTLSGAVSLALEGVFYDYFGGHSLAVIMALATIPVMLLVVLFLPEPSGKTLEEMTGGTAR